MIIIIMKTDITIDDILLNNLSEIIYLVIYIL